MSVFVITKIIGRGFVFNLLLNAQICVLRRFGCRGVCLYLNGLKWLKKPPGIYEAFLYILMTSNSFLRGYFHARKICVIKPNNKKMQVCKADSKTGFCRRFLVYSHRGLKSLAVPVRVFWECALFGSLFCAL